MSRPAETKLLSCFARAHSDGEGSEDWWQQSMNCRCAVSFLFPLLLLWGLWTCWGQEFVCATLILNCPSNSLTWYNVCLSVLWMVVIWERHCHWCHACAHAQYGTVCSGFPVIKRPNAPSWPTMGVVDGCDICIRGGMLFSFWAALCSPFHYLLQMHLG